MANMQRFTFTTSAPRSLASREKPAEQRRERPASEVTAEEEAILTGITKSGQFTLANAVSMYAGVRRLRDQK